MRSPAPVVLVLVLTLVVGACGRGPAPEGGGGEGPERLTLGQAVERARAFAADRGLPDAVLARVERGEAFGPDGRAVWSIALCDPPPGGRSS